MISDKQISKFDILKSDQKDKFYRKKLTNSADQLVKFILKSSSSISINPITSVQDIKLLSDLIYYTCTTLSNRQTIGQEYYNLILFKENTRSLPILSERLFLIAFRIVLPYLVNKLNRTQDTQQKIILSLLNVLLFYAKKINLIIFYLSNSSYFKLENRLASVKTLSINLNRFTSGFQQKMYLAFGLLESTMLGIHVANEIKELYVNRNSLINYSDGNKQEHEQSMNNIDRSGLSRSVSRIKCPLCLDPVSHPTLTTCGHLFCWYCIQEYSSRSSSENAKCPTCRCVFENRKLIYLYNFK